MSCERCGLMLQHDWLLASWGICLENKLKWCLYLCIGMLCSVLFRLIITVLCVRKDRLLDNDSAFVNPKMATFIFHRFCQFVKGICNSLRTFQSDLL